MPAVCRDFRRSYRGAAGLSPAAQRLHDLDDVAFRQLMLAVVAAGHDPTIHFYRYPAIGQALGDEQVGDGAVGGEGEGGAVQSDIHERIVARGR